MAKFYLLLIVWSTNYSGSQSLLRFQNLNECQAALEAVITGSSAKQAVREHLRANSKCLEVSLPPK